MVVPGLYPSYEDLIEFVLGTATPQEILDFTPSPEAAARLEELLERKNTGELTTEEAEELEQTAQLDLVISVLKARALAAIARS